MTAGIIMTRKKRNEPTETRVVLMGIPEIDLKRINDLLGGFDNRVAIHQAVLERLKAEPRLARLKQLCVQTGEPFDYSIKSLAFNVECVHKDASLGRIPTPHTPTEWIEALSSRIPSQCWQRPRSRLVSVAEGVSCA